MRICIAQTRSIKGEIQQNIANHLKIIGRAIEFNSDLIVFPELSITNYEPELANTFATNLEDSMFDSFQKVADKNQIAIGIGMPIKAIGGVHISMLIFQQNQPREIYSKSILHADEFPYFVSGNHQPMLKIKGKNVALGICYETLQREHFVRAKENDADLYIASVAKPDRGTDKAYLHFPSIAREFKTPILMVNSVGFSDNFLSNGLSAVWNSKGELKGQLDEENEGLLIYDTDIESIEIDQLTIDKGQPVDLDELFQIYSNGKTSLQERGIYQWVDNYPTKSIIEEDIKKEVLYVLRNGTEILGAINISEDQEAEYQSIDWRFDDSKVLVIHRLVIHPKYQRNGYGKKLMDFAEHFAEKNYYTSIRLDAYSQNKRVIEFYKRRNYYIRGDVYFPEREFAFHCMEKEVKTS